MGKEKFLMEEIGGRKFVFSILLTIFSFALVLTGFVDSKVWLDFVKFLLASYIAGNVATKFAIKK